MKHAIVIVSGLVIGFTCYLIDLAFNRDGRSWDVNGQGD